MISSTKDAKSAKARLRFFFAFFAVVVMMIHATDDWVQLMMSKVL